MKGLPYAGRSASGAESARWAHAVRPVRPEAALDLFGEGWEGATVCLASPASQDSVGHAGRGRTSRNVL